METPARDTILVVDDDDDLRALVAGILRAGGYTVRTCADAAEALDALAEAPVRCVLSDVRMPVTDGFGLLARVRASWPAVPVILLTAHGELDDAVRALADGAADYLPKPIARDVLLDVVAATLERAQASAVPAERAAQGAPDRGAVVGRSPAMIELYGHVARAAAADVPVVIHGETGVGKEWVARAIHRHSRRRRGAFVAINCAAMPEGTLESELFGHARGSFTGAQGARAGLFQVADKGVLFLDEVGELPLRTQAELLRALQTGELRPVGSDHVVTVDVRVVCATHRDLDALVREGRFREDLLFRLRVLPIEVPPLRDRVEDIPALAEHFLAQIEPRRGLSPDALDALTRRAWRGNVRELRAVLERAAAFARGPLLTAADVAETAVATAAPAEPEVVAPPAEDPIDALLRAMIAQRVLPLDELDERYVKLVLDHLHGNKSQAAEVLGIDRKTIRRVLGRGDARDDT